jgi:AraC-like DNA-binding protein
VRGHLITVSNALVSAIWDGAPLPEPEKEALAERAGLSLEQIRDINERTSILKLARFWDGLLAATNDPFVGLQVGTRVTAERFGLAARTAGQGSDFREVLTRLSRYARLINDVIRYELCEDHTGARFVMRFLWDVADLERHAVDITCAAIDQWARRHLSERPRLLEARFRTTDATARERYERIFGRCVRLGAPVNELLYDADSLLLRVTSADRELGSILERHAGNEIARIQDIGGLPERASQLIYQKLEGGNPVTLTVLCEELRITRREFQRQASEKGTSFSVLVDEARRVLAPRFLSDPSSNVEQTGFRLGYSEPTGFIRAFKKWYGVTPGLYRQRKNPT